MSLLCSWWCRQRAAQLATQLVCLSVMVSCGSDEPPVATRTPFTIWVVDEGVGLTGAGRPLSNVSVAVYPSDPASGEPNAVKTTDAEGRVTFDLDFSSPGSSVMVSAIGPDHTLVTMLDASPETARARYDTFGKPASDLVIVLPRLDRSIRDASIAVRGAINGKQSAATMVRLFSSGVPRLGSTTTKEPSYAELRAPRDAPFFLVAHESQGARQQGDVFTNEPLRSIRIDAPASGTDQVVDVDFSKAAALPQKLLHLRLEPGIPLVVNTRATVDVVSADSSLALGAVRRSAPTADGKGFDVEVDVADLDIAPERVMTRASVVAANGDRLIRTELGVIADGTTVRDFAPTITIPEQSRSLADPLPLDGVPAGADLDIEIQAAGELFWILRAPPGGPRKKTLVLPEPLGIGYKVDVQLFEIAFLTKLDRVALAPHGEAYKRTSIHSIEVRRR